MWEDRVHLASVKHFILGHLTHRTQIDVYTKKSTLQIPISKHTTSSAEAKRPRHWLTSSTSYHFNSSGFNGVTAYNTKHLNTNCNSNNKHEQTKEKGMENKRNWVGKSNIRHKYIEQIIISLFRFIYQRGGQRVQGWSVPRWTKESNLWMKRFCSRTFRWGSVWEVQQQTQQNHWMFLLLLFMLFCLSGVQLQVVGFRSRSERAESPHPLPNISACVYFPWTEWKLPQSTRSVCCETKPLNVHGRRSETVSKERSALQRKQRNMWNREINRAEQSKAKVNNHSSVISEGALSKGFKADLSAFTGP